MWNNQQFSIPLKPATSVQEILLIKKKHEKIFDIRVMHLLDKIKQGDAIINATKIILITLN